MSILIRSNLTNQRYVLKGSLLLAYGYHGVVAAHHFDSDKHLLRLVAEYRYPR